MNNIKRAVPDAVKDASRDAVPVSESTPFTIMIAELHVTHALDVGTTVRVRYLTRAQLNQIRGSILKYKYNRKSMN